MSFQYGEILESQDGYRVQVVWLSEMVVDLMGKPDDLVGKLICDPSHPCANIPHALYTDGYSEVE